MTTVDVCYRYATPPREAEMQAIGALHEVYGIRKVLFDEKARTVTVEYDATRFADDTVANLLRRAGLDVTERIRLV
ncbi:MAG: hypothetical protein HYX26_09910 [Acidobacteriales bacterium]|nr:hypothetical protein [Terriglobales bacterium]